MGALEILFIIIIIITSCKVTYVRKETILWTFLSSTLTSGCYVDDGTVITHNYDTDVY